MKILVVDIETTGFYQYGDAIVEIGIALADTETKQIEIVFDKVVKDKKFKPKKHKDSWIFQNTTLTVDDVEKANSIESYKDEIQGLFDKYKMTAYNKSFDIRFLEAVGFKMDDIKCLMKSATQYSTYKDKNGKIKKPSVEEIYNQFFMTKGEIYIEQHRAGADAIDEAKILLHMVGLKESTALVIEEKIVKPKKEKPTLGLDDEITFGKYNGLPLSKLIKTNPQYLKWCLENVTGFKISEEATELFLKRNTYEKQN